ncbi:tyrosine-type recombinase/integrase [Desulfofustis glycolicus]|uniref:Phage integrase family protein n=1 Tax=Desulfofustis glycolicus DSM 9705 TaxID=1121409 RepID=A0A1M5YQZ3_9BACT|nr:tyrosine-type recombinase/integrase [Desulfofustis glycolicus]SHI14278.1 Phage integrase family protein [Desulfofustis glycolicus DSM 9705]
MDIKNPNHPKKGDQIRVEPLKELQDIAFIKRSLKDKPRDYCLFVFGINTNLRASDLLRITVGEVKGCEPGDELVLKEKKTGKLRRITLNRAVTDAVRLYLESPQGQDLGDDDKLFTGQRGPLTVPSVNRLVKQWCKDARIRGNFGSHTLRKTFGYHQRVQRNTSVPELMAMFNHSSQKQTLDYLCIQADEIRNAYMELCL